MLLSLNALGVDDVASHWSILISLCWHEHITIDVCRPWLMLHVVGQHILLEEKMPWLVFPNDGQCKCRPTDAHTPRIMCTSLCWCCITISSIFFKKRTCHVIYLQTLSKGACRWPMSLSQSTQSLSYVYYCWLTLMSSYRCTHAIGY